ncbi:hypothetical protein [Candidatus Chazhemtobacterium aquaticus]|uniref:Uncharacterized protein n=1 Tax=Candidatus Chazhemtobacterium aquaticus TaxID=2715735 RepID=A0A857N5Z7_9BACT|nr:hypothetical protein [Candidatus Chazhemtobacterium aquaticus]QHO63486.1 hypothetical protein MICH65_0505 [Candidatus Chazhemtobacterium aquaticus]
MKPVKKNKPNLSAHIIYLLFFTAVIMLLPPLLHLPLVLSFLPSLSISSHWFLELSFLFGVTLIPLLVIYVFSKLILVIKKPSYFIILSALLLILVSYLNLDYSFILVNQANATRLLVFGLIFTLYTSLVLSYFWKKIFVKGYVSYAHLLKPSLYLVAFLLFIEWLIMITTGRNLLLDLYILLGESLIELINIFYLDFYGFVGIFFSLLASTTALISLFIHSRWHLS